MQALPYGVYPYRELTKAFGASTVQKMVRESVIKQLRRGWYEYGTARSDEIAAASRGGVITCVSALKRHSVWTPEGGALHVRGDSWAVQHRKGPFCRQFGRPGPLEGIVDDVPTALRHAARCLDDEGFVVVCDSVLNKRIMDVEQLEYQFREAPEGILRLLDRVDGRADSGPETMARLRLRSRNVQLEIQVQIDGVGRVDLLVGKYLIIEIDGFEFHSTRESFQKDRTRDAEAFDRGYWTLRFTYDDIVFRWPATEQVILNAVRDGLHLRCFRGGSGRAA